MLQQTQVEHGRSLLRTIHGARFRTCRRWPPRRWTTYFITGRDSATTRAARNLHRAAQQFVARHGGEFPRDIDAVLELPGIGRSTAGAILALARNERHPILDGNVKRVLARFTAIDGWPGKTANAKTLWELAEQYTPETRVDAYTQAIMDLGATLCTRSKPDCSSCPLNDECEALRRAGKSTFPASAQKRKNRSARP